VATINTTREPGNASQLVAIIDVLTELFSPEGAAKFLRTPLDDVGGVPPVDLLGSSDGEARLLLALHRLEEKEKGRHKKNARRWPGV
jgi:uncharacterized protein (DUF2384 family)